jgi:hypothetical protein
MQHDTPAILISLLKMIFNFKGSVDQEFSFVVKIIKYHFSSEFLIRLTFSYSVQSHDLNKMQHDISDILFYAFKNTFVLKGFICFTDIFINKQFSCRQFINKSIFVTNIDKINNF